jgi:hypothetical protein
MSLFMAISFNLELRATPPWHFYRVIFKGELNE